MTFRGFLLMFINISIFEKRNMTDYKIHIDNGITDIRSGKFQSGIEHINKCLELKKDWEIPYFYRAVANQALDNFDEAMLDYTKALQLNKNMTDAYYNRANITLVRKDIENPDLTKVVTDLEKALELDENFLDALYAMAAVQKRLENYEKAMEYLDRLLAIEPEAIHARALKKLLMQKHGV